jgi:hypothetical protein
VTLTNSLWLARKEGEPDEIDLGVIAAESVNSGALDLPIMARFIIRASH